MDSLKKLRTDAKKVGLTVSKLKNPRKPTEKYRLQGIKAKYYAGDTKQAHYLIEAHKRYLKRIGHR